MRNLQDSILSRPRVFHVPVGLAANASASYTYDTVIHTTSIQVHKRFTVDCTNALQPL